MQIRSIFRGARISAFKAREVAREIQGLPVAAALDVVAFSAKKAAAMIGKTLKSAIANAENNNNLRIDALVVCEATVGEGPTFKRFQPKARGSAGPIRKRTSHIRIVLTDEIMTEKRRSKRTLLMRGGSQSVTGGRARQQAPKGSLKFSSVPPADSTQQQNT